MPIRKRLTSPNLAAQHDYVRRVKASNFKFGLTVGEAFIRGIRDLGYKNNATALSELIDNSIQAGAGRVDVGFGYEKTISEKKPTEIFVVDNGHGMEPDMIRLAVMWGGTHREGDRTGMGRYGYGLPSSCVSIGQSFTVYSQVEGAGLHAVTVDLVAIGRGDYTNSEGEIIVPPARAAELPKSVRDYIAKAHPDGWTQGTVVVIESLDRLEWTTAGGLRENLMRHFGVTYHKLMTEIQLYVQGDYVEPIDPLFLTPGFRFHDLDRDRAHAFEAMTIVVKDPNTREAVGQLIVRFSYMPPTFGSVDKSKDATGKNANPRFAVMREYHGVIFSRMGRLIDVVARTPWTTFINNDRYIKVEVEFPAALDEEFGITTSKQQVTISDRIWEILRQNGVPKAIEQLRIKVKELKAKRKEETEAAAGGERRPSASAIETAKTHMRGPSLETQARQQARGEEQLRKSAEDRAEQTGRPVEEEAEQMALDLQDSRYRVEIESAPSGPFFRCDMFGAAKVLYINRSHRFYSDVYSGPKSSYEVRQALEVLLFAIGDSMLDAPEENQRVYRVELPQWSVKLDLALEQLGQNVALSHDGDAEEPAWSPPAAAVQ